MESSGSCPFRPRQLKAGDVWIRCLQLTRQLKQRKLTPPSPSYSNSAVDDAVAAADGDAGTVLADAEVGKLKEVAICDLAAGKLQEKERRRH